MQEKILSQQYHSNHKNLPSSQLRLLPLLANSAQSLNGSLQVWCFIFRLFESFEQLATTNEDSDLTPLLQTTVNYGTPLSHWKWKWKQIVLRTLATLELPLLWNKSAIQKRSEITAQKTAQKRHPTAKAPSRTFTEPTKYKEITKKTARNAQDITVLDGDSLKLWPP